jgi:hypothetical protein
LGPFTKTDTIISREITPISRNQGWINQTKGFYEAQDTNERASMNPDIPHRMSLGISGLNDFLLGIRLLVIGD